MANTPAKSEAGEDVESAGFASSEPGQESGAFQEKADRLRARIGAQTRETTERVRSEGEHLLRDQKNRVADRIGHYGSAVHRAAHKLEDEQDAAIAYYTHRAAEQLDRAAHYLRAHDWSDLRRDAEVMARRHPEIFFGGLLLAGLALARLLKASHEERRDEEWHGSGGMSHPTVGGIEPPAEP
jgi:hypothetical protein